MTTEDKKEDLPEVKELEDGSLQIGKDEPEAKNTAESEDDERLTESKEDAESEEQGHDEETSEEAEARKERNRARRAQNKLNRQNYIESLRRDLASRDQVINELASRVASVEQHSVGNQIAQLEAGLKEAADVYNHFKTVSQRAIEMADGAAATDAQEKMFAARQRFEMLENAKKTIGQRTQQPKPLDPRMLNNAKTWLEENSWYDPSGADEDSYLVTKLDERLVAEGWNPSTKEYWEELTARVKKRLPHRSNSGYNNVKGTPASKPRVPVGGSGGENSSSSKGAYRLSAERVNALKEAGIYEDPVRRAKAIKNYQEYDRQHADRTK